MKLLVKGDTALHVGSNGIPALGEVKIEKVLRSPYYEPGEPPRDGVYGVTCKDGGYHVVQISSLDLEGKSDVAA